MRERRADECLREVDSAEKSLEVRVINKTIPSVKVRCRLVRVSFHKSTLTPEPQFPHGLFCPAAPQLAEQSTDIGVIP